MKKTTTLLTSYHATSLSLDLVLWSDVKKMLCMAERTIKTGFPGFDEVALRKESLYSLCRAGTYYAQMLTVQVRSRKIIHVMNLRGYSEYYPTQHLAGISD